ncbi:MAG TPA: TIR domain-containing protein [Rhizomicrobium sp.]|jgi:tetratricopeptide (TPR) repeat protein
MAGDAVDAAAHYWAFISYSHKDAAFGQRLHRRLESYYVPRRLVGRTTRQGVVPRRLAPIFLDREELPAAADLSTEVRAALARSRSLIVVCSPDGAASPWVSREVELFRSLHPDRPIFAAIRNGDPAQSFPAALYGNGPAGERLEPLAADFRPGRDGNDLGRLKLIAGIAGLGLDELSQRDAQRYRQRVTAITVISLIAVLAMAGLTLAALRARKEADRQRSEAEGLVEYMLTDLRDRLKGVGRLDVMTAVNQRALNYYRDQDLASLPVDSLGRRARILHAMGADDEDRDDYDGALKKFLEAKRTTAALLAAAPNDPQRIFDHAQSEYWVASVDTHRRQFESAIEGMQRYAALAHRLVAIDPQNPKWQMEAGYAASNLGTIEIRDAYDPVKANLNFSIALQYFQAALRSKPGNTEIIDDIADGYSWLCTSQRALGHYDEARASCLREASLLQGLLSKDPKNAEDARDILPSAIGLARIDLKQGRIADAKRRLTKAFADGVRLSAADPEDHYFAQEVIAIGLFLIDAIIQGGKPDVGQTETILSWCQTAAAKGDQEVMDYCAVDRARVAAATGHPDVSAIDYLKQNHARLDTIRHSQRWGIDFSQICSQLHCSTEQVSRGISVTKH